MNQPQPKDELTSLQQTPRRFTYYAIASGTYASLSSVLGKLAADPRAFLYFQKAAEFFKGDKFSFGSRLASLDLRLDIAFRLGFFAAMALTNGLMWMNYTKALDLSSNSINVVVVNLTTNIFVTAAFGIFLFSEPLNLLWWLGASLVVTGTGLISHANKDSSNPLTPVVTDVEKNKKLR